MSQDKQSPNEDKTKGDVFLAPHSFATFIWDWLNVKDNDNLTHALTDGVIDPTKIKILRADDKKFNVSRNKDNKGQMFGQEGFPVIGMAFIQAVIYLVFFYGYFFSWNL